MLTRRVAARLFAEVEGGREPHEVLRKHDLFSEQVGDDVWVSKTHYPTIEEHVANADDESLVRAFENLYGVDHWEDTPKAWRPGRYRLFASHSSEDKRLVGDVRRALDPLGIDLFVAHDNIDPGDEWIEALKSALATCHGVSAFLTPDFRESKWTDQEVGIAFGRNVTILPHKLHDDVSPYGFIGKFQALRERTPEKIADEIFSVLLDSAWIVLAEGLVNELEDADSFDEANAAAERIGALRRFPIALADSLRYAKHYNNQADKRAWYVSANVEAALTRLA